MIEYLNNNPVVVTFFASFGLVLAAFLANFLLKRLLPNLIDKFLAKTNLANRVGIRRFGIIPRLANIVPALILSVGIKFVPGLPAEFVGIVRNVCNALIILSLALATAAVLDFIEAIYRRQEMDSSKSIRSYIQVAKIALFAIAAVLILATIMDRSPIILLSGLSAMAAVLILVFQDTLLSFVASIQINSTDMVRVGDWIEVPHLNADGDVIEIALHTVKVQNWDKTITTIPIRKLVTDPFKNWRGMQESGGRRIKRSLFLDQSSIRFLTAAEKAQLLKIELLHNYLTVKDSEISQWNQRLGDQFNHPANTRRLTNIGTFRIYVANYLRNHPGIHQGMTMISRQLQPTSEGLPLEIYCFTNTIAWVQYEEIQADIFDHLYAILPEFGLRAYQQPSGNDLASAFGALSANPAPHNIEPQNLPS